MLNNDQSIKCGYKYICIAILKSNSIQTVVKQKLLCKKTYDQHDI